jgi:amidase
LARGESLGRLHGVPMTVKESFDVAGMGTTWGDPANAHEVAPSNAASVQSLISQGAIVFGKTNVPTMLADWQTFNPLHGTTNNPWNPQLAPGGSSGGAAAALAAGLTTLELGSDIGASIRNPAHYCGVYGHKPTYGIVPQAGHHAGRADTPLDLIACGPLARSADDLAAALDILVAPEPSEAHWGIALPPTRIDTLKGIRVAAWVDDETCPVDAEIRDAVVRVGGALERAGAKVDWEARPFDDSQAEHELYIQMLRGATGPLLSDEDYRTQAALAAGLDSRDTRYLAWNARYGTQSHRDWFDGHRRRARLRAQWGEFFRRFDVVICPVASSTAFPHDQKTPRVDRRIRVNDGWQDYNSQLFWAGLATLCYLPSTVVPAGLSKQGLPVGLQIIGSYGHDRSTIRLAQLLAEEIGGFVAPAAYL